MHSHHVPFATIASTQDAKNAAAKVERIDYFADYALTQDQRGIERIMRSNRADFLR